MDDAITRKAVLELAGDTDNIIKVAGLLSKIKKWVLESFSPSARIQMRLIDEKYMQLKPMIRAVDDDIAAIEKSIEDIDMLSYDSAVQRLVMDIGILDRKLKETKHAISETTPDVMETPDAAPRQPKARKSYSDLQPIKHGTFYKMFTPGKTLAQAG